MATMDEMNKPDDGWYADMIRKVVNAAINNYAIWNDEQRVGCASSVAGYLIHIRDYKAYTRALIYVIQCPDLYRLCERREWS